MSEYRKQTIAFWAVFPLATCGMLSALRADEHTPTKSQGAARQTDETVHALVPRFRLEALDLRDGDITNRGVAEIVGLKQLRTINLSSTWITDRAIPILADLPNLQELDVSCTELSDAACEEMPRLKALTSLNLDYTDVTSGGVSFLVGCEKLTSLSLRHTEIGDRCVDDLCKLKSLTKLDLRDTRITVDAAKKLRRSFGDRCTIEQGRSKRGGDCLVPDPPRRKRPGRTSRPSNCGDIGRSEKPIGTCPSPPHTRCLPRYPHNQRLAATWPRPHVAG